MKKVNPELFTNEMISFIINNQEHDFQDEWFLLESNGELYDINLVGDTFTESGNSEIVVYEVYEEDDTLETNVNNFYKITKNDIEKWRLENAQNPPLRKADVICSDCGAVNSIRWEKKSIDIDDKQGSYKDLTFDFCEECGNVTNIDLS